MLYLGNMPLDKVHPAERGILHIGESPLICLGMMNAFEKLYAVFHGLIKIYRIVTDKPCHVDRIQKLGNRAVPLANTDYPVRNCRIDAENKRASRVFSLLLYLGERVLGIIDLQDSLVIISDRQSVV